MNRDNEMDQAHLPRRAKKLRVVPVRMEEDKAWAFAMYAAANDITLSDVVRKALDMFGEVHGINVTPQDRE